ncbi:MAG: agmatine deiminase family protein, partial [Actinomycetota bacterium]
MIVNRRAFLASGAAVVAAGLLPACTVDGDEVAVVEGSDSVAVPPGFWMPAEEERHEVTWMCMPARRDVWGRDLPDVQATIAEIALATAAFEPVRMLVQPGDLDAAFDLVGSDVELIEASVDDLWARDTLPLFLVSESGDLAAGR